MFYGEVERSGNIFYVNAGHPPPLLVYNSQVRQLDSTGLILGAVSEITLHRASTSFESDAVLVIYSDGLLERYNDADEEFGLSRLKKLIVQNQSQSAQEIFNIIYKNVFAFGNETKWEDDVTIVVIKRL